MVLAMIDSIPCQYDKRASRVKPKRKKIAYPRTTDDQRLTYDSAILEPGSARKSSFVEPNLRSSRSQESVTEHVEDEKCMGTYG